jgi:hypothetical protein
MGLFNFGVLVDSVLLKDVGPNTAIALCVIKEASTHCVQFHIGQFAHAVLLDRLETVPRKLPLNHGTLGAQTQP